MAYNTSRGARGLGDIKNEDDLDTQIDFENDQITLKTNNIGRFVVDNTEISASGAATIVGNVALGAALNVTGAISGSNGGFLAVTATALNLQSGGITNAGAVAGATTVSGAASTFTTLGATSLALQSGGITAAGAIAGATTVTAAGVMSGAAIQGTDGTLTSLNLQNGGITNAGTISGLTFTDVSATSLSASSTLEAVGATTLGSTLNVTGAIAAASSISGSGVGSFGSLVLDGAANLQSSGITNAGAIAGASTVSGSGIGSFGGLVLDAGANLQSAGITNAGAIAGATTLSGTAITATTIAGTALTLQNGGITAAGSISATTLSSSATLEAVGPAILGGTLSVSGTSTFSGVSTHEAHPVFETGITIKNADDSAGYINFYEQSSNGTNVCTFRGKSSMGNCTITLPGDTGTVVLEDNTVTLSNKTIASPTLTGTTTAAAISGSGTLEVAGNAYFGSALNVSGTLYVSSSTPPRGSLAAVMTRAATTDAFPLEVLRLEVPDTATAGVNTTIGMGPKLSFYTPNSSEPGGSFEGAYIAAEKENTGDARDDMSLTLATCPQGGTVTERMRINSDGNVGINTQQPTNTLEIVGTVSGSSTLEIVGNTYLGGTLNVTGASTFSSFTKTTAVSGSGGLQFVGATILGNTLVVSGNVGATPSLGLGTSTVHASENNYLSIANGTEPSFATADQISIGSKDSTGYGSGNGATLSINTEGLIENSPANLADLTHRVSVWINGTEYFLYLDPV